MATAITAPSQVVEDDESAAIDAHDHVVRVFVLDHDVDEHGARGPGRRPADRAAEGLDRLDLEGDRIGCHRSTTRTPHRPEHAARLPRSDAPCVEPGRNYGARTGP